MSFRQYCAVISCTIAMFGCGPKVNVVPASGTITLDNEALAHVNISTQPIETEGSSVDYPGSEGRADQHGRFALRLQTGDKEGAVVGKHAVYITFGHDPTLASNAEKTALPRKYWDGSLRLTIPEGGSDQLNLALESK